MSGLTDFLTKTLTRFLGNMLVRTILLPSVLKVHPDRSNADYATVVRLLHDLQKNGVVLVDEAQYIIADLSQDIGNLPEKFRKRTQVLLKELKRKNRFVPVPLKNQVQAICKNKPCQYGIGIAKEYLPPAIIVSQGCNECARSQLASFPNIEVVDVAEYSISDFFENCLSRGDRVLSSGEWKQDKFEQEILIPLFRDAKHVKIYDRYIGRTVWEYPDPGQMTDAYKLSIEWMLEVFLKKSRWGVNGEFEVCSGLNKLSPDQISTAVTELRKYESEIRHAYSFPKFKMTIKKEITGQEMPHDRYLITNQVAVSVGRGFDWLLDKRNSLYPRRLRDVTIAYFSEPGKIEQVVRTLPDL